MKKINLEIFMIPILSISLVIVGAIANYFSNQKELKEKNEKIADLERALDVMEEANTSLKTDNETKQIIIDNLEYELSQAK